MSQIRRERKLTISRNTLCWINTKTSEINEDIHNTIEQLRHSVHSVYIFEDLNTCIDFITDIDENETVYLVICEPLEEQLMSLIDSITQIKTIYLICRDTRIDDGEWSKECRKVKRINDQIGKINLQIKREIRRHSNELMAFQTYTRPANFDKSLSNDLNSSFLYSQLIKEMLVDVEMEYDQDYMNNFIDVCHAENQDNNSQLVNITSFQRSYKNHSAVWWYTKESFLYSTVNRALRTQDVTTLFMMGFFIRDLHLQLIELQQTNPKNQSLHTVYRGQGMIDSEFQRLQQNIGGLLSFNNFLSTSSDYDVSLMFARSAGDNPEHIGVLFHMHLDSTIESQSPFASLHGVSFYPDENEILFSMHTIFRIVDVRQIETRLWLIELHLTNEKDEQLSELLTQLRSEIHVSAVFNVDKVGQLCLKMGDYDGALEVYETLLELFPDNQVLLTYLHHHLGLVYQNKNDFNQAIIHYEKAIEIRRSLVAENEVDRHSVTTYGNLSTLYVKIGDLNQARKYCERALAISTQLHHGEEYDPIIHCHHLANLAFIQHAESNFDDSLTNYQKVIDLRLQYLPPYHPDFVVAYSNLATVQGSMKNYMAAVQSLKRALEISKKSLPDNHDTLAMLHYNIAIAFENWQKYDEAFKHIQCAIEIAQQVKPFDQDKLQYWTNLADEFKQNSNTK